MTLYVVIFCASFLFSLIYFFVLSSPGRLMWEYSTSLAVDGVSGQRGTISFRAVKKGKETIVLCQINLPVSDAFQGTLEVSVNEHLIGILQLNDYQPRVTVEYPKIRSFVESTPNKSVFKPKLSADQLQWTIPMEASDLELKENDLAIVSLGNGETRKGRLTVQH